MRSKFTSEYLPSITLTSEIDAFCINLVWYVDQEDVEEVV